MNMKPVIDRWARRHETKGREAGLAEGRAEGRAEGEARGRFNTLLANIRSLMETAKFTMDAAMDVLNVPGEDRAKLHPLLEGK